jgi:hypothetical protein
MLKNDDDDDLYEKTEGDVWKFSKFIKNECYGFVFLFF